MKLKKIVILVCLFIVLLALSSCKEPEGDDEGPDKIDYTSYPTNYSIQIRNSTNQKLVAFKGALSASTLIGGIPAQATAHALKRDPALFSATGDFPVIFLTEEQYKTNKSNLASPTLAQTPFTRIYAFYNASGTNETVYEISGHLGGNNRFLIQNVNSSMNVEIRVNGVNGATLGYASAGMANTTLFLEDNDYLIFPVFRKYNAVRDVITTVYPKRQSGEYAGTAWRTSFALEGNIEFSFDTSACLADITWSTGAAYLVIENNASDTGVQLQKGGVIQRTTTGIATINNGFSRTYQIDMPLAGAEGNYAASTTIAGAYKIGPIGDLEFIDNKGSNASGDQEWTLAVDKIYTITVSGSASIGGLRISPPVESGDIDKDVRVEE
ncbi:MAG: hypothetical protein Ta2G_13330 [Termitinemataceae bacterium]|nr:MAG: hypothetical protein Ta2G_13330 [Termitinemataceae bacterium]